MKTDEQYLEEYRQWINDMYGWFQMKDLVVKAATIFEDYDPIGFQKGLTEFILSDGEEYDPRN